MGIYRAEYRDEPARIEWEGRVLCDREENYYDDSDGYSHVWDADEGVVKRVGTWTTRAYSLYSPGQVDAYDGPHEADIRQWHIDRLTDLWLKEQADRYDDDCREARKVSKGAYVVVVKGRKVPIGTEGVVFWMKEANYGYYDTDKYRIGIDTGNGEVEWTYADNCVVIDPDMPDPEDYLGEVEFREKLAGLTTAKLHGMLCAYTSNLRYIP